MATGQSTANLTWTQATAIPGPVTDNHIYAYDGGSCSGSPFTYIDLGSPATSFSPTGLWTSTTYSWEVTASSSYGEGPASNCATATTTNGHPAAPTGLTAMATGPSTANLTWTQATAIPGRVTDNHIYAYDGGSCSGSPFTYIDLGSPATSFALTGLWTSTTYSWEVTASSSYGEGPASNCATATTTNGHPAAPTGLTAIATARRPRT